MAVDKKISELTAWTPINTDVIPYVDLTTWETKKALKSDLKWDAATLDVGTTTTLTSWSPATVVNSGTTSAAIFDFGIPKGDTWATWPTWPTGATWPAGADWLVQSIVAGNKMSVDNTDPANPIASVDSSTSAKIDWAAQLADANTFTNTGINSFAGSVWVKTTAPSSSFSVAEKLRMFDTTPTGAAGTTDNWYLFGSTIPAGSFTEVSWQILSYWINVPQTWARDTANAGGIFRFDTRASQKKFSILWYISGWSLWAERFSANLDTGVISMWVGSWANVSIWGTNPVSKLTLDWGASGSTGDFLSIKRGSTDWRIWASDGVEWHPSMRIWGNSTTNYAWQFRWNTGSANIFKSPSWAAWQTVMEVKGAASQSGNYLNISSSTGSGDILSVDSSGNTTVSWTVAWTNITTAWDVTGTATNLSWTPALPNWVTATTQAPSDNSTKLATTAYVDAASGWWPTAMFSAHPVSNITLTWTLTKMNFNAALINDWDYNTTTARYTAPSTWQYFIWMDIYIASTFGGDQIYFRIYKNWGNIKTISVSGSSIGTTVSSWDVITLNAWDYIELYWANAAASSRGTIYSSWISTNFYWYKLR